MKREGQMYFSGERSEKRQGPFTEQELRRYWAYGMVKDDDLIWFDDSSDGVQVREFFNITSEKISKKELPSIIIQRPVEWQSPGAVETPDASPIVDKPWILQVFAWLVALAATVCFLSLPGALWLSVSLFAASLLLLAWYIWIKHSMMAWLSLGMNVLLVAAVFIYQPIHENSKTVMDSSSIKISQPTAADNSSH